MKTLSLIALISSVSLAACAAAPAPKPVQPVETTSANVPDRAAFTPPDAWEMNIADKPEAAPVKGDAPVFAGQAETTASKRQGRLINLPGKAPATPTEK